MKLSTTQRQGRKKPFASIQSAAIPLPQVRSAAPQGEEWSIACIVAVALSERTAIGPAVSEPGFDSDMGRVDHQGQQARITQVIPTGVFTRSGTFGLREPFVRMTLKFTE